jgi:hypothetical protein
MLTVSQLSDNHGGAEGSVEQPAGGAESPKRFHHGAVRFPAQLKAIAMLMPSP